MTPKKSIHFAALSLLTIVYQANGEEFEGKGVKVELASEVTAIKPGQSFSVALRISHDPGFHTYWKNPGTVGMPTDIRWELPEGFKAGPLVWQPPERSKMFKYDVYGYETNATLLTEIQAPEALPEGLLMLQAKASWMACNDSSCNPGYHTFKIPLRKTGKTTWNAPVRERVAKALKQLPKPLPNLRAKAEEKGRKVRLRMEGLEVERLPEGQSFYFFSSLNHYQIDPKQKIRLKKGILTVTMTKADYAPDKIAVVKGILRFPKKEGQKESLNVLVQAIVE